MKSSYHGYWGKAERDASGSLSYHLLPYHGLDAAAVGQVLLCRDDSLRCGLARLLGSQGEPFLGWWVLCLALHDTGKFSEGFQNLVPDLLMVLKGRKSSRGYAIRHDALGFALWKDHLSNSAWRENWFCAGDERRKRHWEGLMGALMRPAAGHHGTPPKSSGANSLPIRSCDHFGFEEREAAEAFARDAARVILGGFEPTAGALDEGVGSGLRKVSWLFAGLTVLCDWLASGYFPFVAEPMPLENYWQDHALPRAEQVLTQSGVLPAAPSFSATPASLFPAIDELTPLQHHAAHCAVGEGPQLFILEDVTGSGKTEAAIILAQRLMMQGRGDGIFVALPTMATSNAMYERLAACYERLFEPGSRPSLVLAHSARHLSRTFRQSLGDSYPGARDEIGEEKPATAQCAAWLADNRKKALWADVGVGTLDQVLLSILPSRYQSLRLAGLARRVLVVDEVHAYDPYMHELLRNLLLFHAALGGSAILLSATIPSRMRRQLAQSFAAGLGIDNPGLQSSEYPLVTHVSTSLSAEVALGAVRSRRIEQAIELVHDLTEIHERVVRVATSGHCVCWIRNTVHDAMEACEMLRAHIPSERLILFHARFAMGDRLEAEEKVCGCFGRRSDAGTRSGMVLVATQVVEQSLDLDFDVLISDLAPMDLLIQRAGRLRRHPRDAAGNLLKGGEARDLRPPEPFLIHAPVPSDDVEEDWYEGAFPRAAYVYPSHGRLWLTARLLGEMKGWRMPEDARRLVEAVYSDGMEERIPLPLLARDDQESARRSAERSLAHLNMLKLEDGYAATPNQWVDDTQAPTRLGELQTTLRLARWSGGELAPWHSEGDFPWDMSQVSVSARLVHCEDVPKDHELRNAVERCKGAQPDHGKWSVLVPLSIGEDGRWRGMARGPKGEPVMITYDSKTGLNVFRAGD